MFCGIYHWVVRKSCMDTAAFPTQPGLVKIVPQFGFIFFIQEKSKMDAVNSRVH